MKIVGLITEYNPFHKGHEYHIQKAKELTDADFCVVIMSGNFVQRGTPAFIDKHTRTQIALKHGADVVFELPVPFSCASAEYFATAAVTLLHKMGCVDYICFGSECNDVRILNVIASDLVDAKLNPEHKINTLIKKHLKTGLSYAAARSAALTAFYDEYYASLVDMPNNILAIEYLKALKMLNSKMEPVSILRTNASYHDSEDNDVMYSASSLRAEINSSDTLEELYSFEPIYKDVIGRTAPITENDFTLLLGEKIISTFAIKNAANIVSDLNNLMGFDTSLANRLSNFDILYSYTSFSELVRMLKTKNIAYTSVSRAILALTLDIKKADMEAYLNNGIASYIRLLGFKKNSTDVLNLIKNNGELTIIGQLSEANSYTSLSPLDINMLSHTNYCDELYNIIVRSKYNIQIPSEYTRKITIV